MQSLQLLEFERVSFNKDSFPTTALASFIVIIALTKQQAKRVAEMPAIPSTHINARPVGSMGQQLEDSADDSVFAVLARVA
jgi:hypothetical protein